MRDEDTELMILGGLYLLSQVEFAAPRAVKAVERGGAKIWEAVHSDTHDEDLPANAMTRAQIRALVTPPGFRFEQPDVAVAIALAESGGYPDAHGDKTRGHSWGLWQINLRAHPEFSAADMVNPHRNAAAAYKISRGGVSWKPWTTYRTGAYRRFLK